jgi:hypothetical protein
MEDEEELDLDGSGDLRMEMEEEDKLETEDEEDNEKEDLEAECETEETQDEDHGGAEPPAKERKSSDPCCLFTTGLGFSSPDDKSWLRIVVELAVSKTKISDVWHPDPSMQGVIIRWARKSPCNFAANVINSNFVVAREIAFNSPFDPSCSLQSWVLTRGRGLKGKFHVECKSRLECLQNANLTPNLRALDVKVTIKAVFQNLETPVLPLDLTPPPPSMS